MSKISIFKATEGIFYPEKQSESKPLPERLMDVLVHSRFTRANTSRRATARFFREVEGWEKEFAGFEPDQLKSYFSLLRPEFRKSGFEQGPVARAFAIIREITEKKIGIRHSESQVLGGWALLNGMVIEQEAGDGNPLTAMLPACTAALSGIPVHIVSASEFHARRNAEWMRPVCESLDLRLGLIVTQMNLDARREAYRNEITCCTYKDLAIDYLRDRRYLGNKSGYLQTKVKKICRVSHESPILRGLYYAIIEDIDHILVDEVRNPLVISSDSNDEIESLPFELIFELSRYVHEGVDYNILGKEIRFTKEGMDRLSFLSREIKDKSGMKSDDCIELLKLSLTALCLRSGKDYRVENEKITINENMDDEFHLFSDRLLIRFLELKEFAKLSKQKEILGRVTYQRLFRKYILLSGITETAKEVAEELRSMYGLKVYRSPSKNLSRHTILPDRFFLSEEQKLNSLLNRIRELHDVGRSVLVGVRTPETAERLIELLTAENLHYRIETGNRTETAAEEKTVRITVAVGRMGRCQKLGILDETVKSSGLDVIAGEIYDFERFDRQLLNRCGEMGSFERFISLEDELLTLFLKSKKGLVLKCLFTFTRHPLFGRRIAIAVQKHNKLLHREARKDLIQYDEGIETSISFSSIRE